MTNENGFIDQAARRAQALPMARIVAAMLGASAAFFALAMPPRIVGGLLGLAGVPVGAGTAVQLLFAILFSLLAAVAGWLAMTLVAGDAAHAPIVQAPSLPRKRPVGATSSDPAPTLRKGDAHPDAPARRPIFAKNDLGTPFDEIVTDRRIVRPAPETEFATPAAAVDLDRTVILPPPPPPTPWKRSLASLPRRSRCRHRLSRSAKRSPRPWRNPQFRRRSARLHPIRWKSRWKRKPPRRASRAPNIGPPRRARTIRSRR